MHADSQNQQARWPLMLWVIPDAVLALLLTGVLTLPVVLVAAGLRWWVGESLLGGIGPVGPVFFFVLVLLQNLSLCAVVLLRVVGIEHRSLAWLGIDTGRVGPLLLQGLLAGLAFLVLNFALSWFFTSAGIEQNQAAQYPLRADDWAGQLLVALGGTLLAPIGEELFFRGYAHAALRESLGSFWAVLLGATLFALAHLLSATEGLVALLVPVFLLGLLLGLLRERTGSILPGLVAHGLNNGIGMALLVLCTNTPTAALCR